MRTTVVKYKLNNELNTNHCTYNDTEFLYKYKSLFYKIPEVLSSLFLKFLFNFKVHFVISHKKSEEQK